MPPEKSKAYKLPKHLLEMKFMKRTKDKEEHQKEDEDRQTMFSHEITNGMLSEGPKFIEEPSLVPLLGLMEGRFSFRGMNPEIERLMASEELIKKEKEEKLQQEKKEKSVSDLDMAKQLGNLSSSMARKFQTKRARGSEKYNDIPVSQAPSENYIAPRKKPKFLKPNLDFDCQ